MLSLVDFKSSINSYFPEPIIQPMRKSTSIFNCMKLGKKLIKPYASHEIKYLKK